MPMDLAIETEGLSKTFRRRWSKQEFRAVQDVSLRVERGTTFGLLGPNGAGKTTFVKMLLSCAHPTSGRAKVFGMDSRIPAARRPIGYLPENHRFPTYMTGRGMLDFYGALSGMDGAPGRSASSSCWRWSGSSSGAMCGWANTRRACCSAWDWRRR